MNFGRDRALGAAAAANLRERLVRPAACAPGYGERIAMTAPFAEEKVRAAIEAFQASADRLPHLPSHDLERRSRVMARMGSITRPDALADMIAQWAPGSVAQKQQVLETLEPLARLEAAVALVRLASASAA